MTFHRIIATALLLTCSTMTTAEPKLLSSSPKANASAAKLVKISMDFNEAINAKATRATILMTGMPGMTDHPPMPISGFTLQMGGGGKTLSLLLQKALVPGTYQVNWQTMGADKRPAKGSFSFTAK